MKIYDVITDVRVAELEESNLLFIYRYDPYGECYIVEDYDENQFSIIVDSQDKIIRLEIDLWKSYKFLHLIVTEFNLIFIDVKEAWHTFKQYSLIELVESNRFINCYKELMHEYTLWYLDALEGNEYELDGSEWDDYNTI